MNPFGRNAIDSKATEGTAAFALSKQAQFGADYVTPPIFYRMIVLDVLPDPTALTAEQIDRFEHVIGIINGQHLRVAPRNSIVARRVLDGTSSAVEPPTLLFPFFPSHFAFPCKPGEHVWTLFESESKRHDMGYWMFRITEPHHVDDVNHTHAPRAFDPSFVSSTSAQFEGNTPSYEFRNGRPEISEDGSRYTVAESALLAGDERAYERLISGGRYADIIVREPVPRYRKRPADLAIEGSNNTLIVLGTDRAGALADATADGTQTLPERDVRRSAGMIDLVVGRGQTDATAGQIATNSLGHEELAKGPNETSVAEGDPDMITDRARLYIAQSTHVDANFALTDLSAEFAGLNDGRGENSATVLSADKIRLIARGDVEIIATGTETDATGRVVRSTDAASYAAVVLKSNGDIILRPGKGGAIRLGHDKSEQHVVLGDELVSYLTKLVTTFNTHMHPGEVATPPPPLLPFPVTPSTPASQMQSPTPSLLSDFTFTNKAN